MLKRIQALTVIFSHRTNDISTVRHYDYNSVHGVTLIQLVSFRLLGEKHPQSSRNLFHARTAPNLRLYVIKI